MKKNNENTYEFKKRESEIDDDDFELKMKSPMKIIKRQKVDRIKEEIWNSNERIYY